VAMKKPGYRIFFWILSVLVLFFIVVAGLVNYGSNRIKNELRFNENIKVSFEMINLSSSYYVYFTFKVSGDPELKRAYWRMKGNQVQVEK
jgi:hypothetical protein